MMTYDEFFVAVEKDLYPILHESFGTTPSECNKFMHDNENTIIKSYNKVAGKVEAGELKEIALTRGAVAQASFCLEYMY